MEWLSLKELPRSLWIVLPSPIMTALGTSLLNKKEVVYIRQSVALPPFQCEKNVKSGKPVTICPSAWLVDSCNAVSENEREKKEHSVFFPKKGIHVFLPVSSQIPPECIKDCRKKLRVNRYLILERSFI